MLSWDPLLHSIESSDITHWVQYLLTTLHTFQSMLHAPPAPTSEIPSTEAAAHPTVQTTYASWFLYNTVRQLTDFPFDYNSTDYVKLYGNLGIYIYGFYVMLIVFSLIAGYASLGLLDKYLVQIALIDPLTWLRRYN